MLARAEYINENCVLSFLQSRKILHTFVFPIHCEIPSLTLSTLCLKIISPTILPQISSRDGSIVLNKLFVIFLEDWDQISKLPDKH